MKQILFLIVFYSFGFTSIVDDYHLFQAQKAFNNNDLNSSLSHYNKIKNKTNDIYYNMGNILYKQKKYEESKQYYKEVKGSKLQSKILHNLGNAYVQTNQPDKAITYYEKALEIGSDEDTKFNLELLKKQQEQNQQNQNQDNKDQENQEQKDSQDKNQQEQNEQQKQNAQDKKDEAEQNKEQQKQQEQKEKEEQQKQDKQSAKENKQEQNENNSSQNINQQKMEQHLSDMEEKRWNKQLENRAINTLMMPIQTKGEKKNENINPW